MSALHTLTTYIADSVDVESERPISIVPSCGRDRLRVGLVVEHTFERHWIADLVYMLKNKADVDLRAVVIFEQDRARAEQPKEPMLFRFWRSLDRFLFATSDDCRESRFAGYRLDFVTHGGRTCTDVKDRLLSSAGFDRLKQSNLDLIVQIGALSPAPELSGVAKYGSWWIPEPSLHGSKLVWFWAMCGKRKIFDAVVKTLSPEGPRRILRRSTLVTDTLSLLRNFKSKQRKISETLVSELLSLRQSDLDYFEFLKTLELDKEEDLQLQSAPSNLDLVKFIVRWTWEGFSRHVERWFWKQHWFVAYRTNTGTIPATANSMADFRILKSTNERFYADPFPIEKDGKSYIFLEDYPFDRGKGLISYVEVTAAGPSTPKVALEQPYHLSYPFIFEHQGEIYMVPESLECRRVDLYRAVNFPDVWTLEKTLIDDIAAVDPTILFHNGKVWLFVSGVASKHSINEELFLFYADSLHGEWTPHPCNPIVSDVRRARPAGRVFVKDGELIRPAQDCAPEYGRAVCFNQIEVLTETEYREKPISIIGPEWRRGNRGTHTFNQSETLQVVDGRMLVRRSELFRQHFLARREKQRPDCAALLQSAPAESVYSQRTPQQIG